MPYMLTVNGKPATVDVPADMPLLWVLRDVLDLKKTVTTIEGLSADGTHPLQLAWAEMDVPQCGYCQAGQIMSAAALLKTTPQPTDPDIDRAMAGNICRCATYVRIRAAIHQAAGEPPVRSTRSDE